MAGARRQSGDGQRRRLTDQDFARTVEEARSRYNLSDVIGRRTTLKRAGREMVGLCVFHQERSPSLRVNDDTGLYHCFGCGASGDVIRFIQDTEGLRFLEALAALGAADLPVVDPAERARRAAEGIATRAAALIEARETWDRCIPAAGTPAEIYARSRGITMQLPPSIRFGRVYSWRDPETGEVGPDRPALVGAVTDAAGDVVAVQRIFLRDGGRAKAKMKRPKLSLGRIVGGALKLDADLVRDLPEHDLLSPASGLAEVIITEGPEDALSLAQELPGRRVWAALGTAMMPSIEYGPEVRAICVAGQNDDAGSHATKIAAAALADRGYRVRTMFPADDFKDWNDQLRGIRR